ncbi:MAG: aspartyl protease family protein [Saprospiraceae bacterium]|nr:aspartyl protease family protein [Saprospiraceae bacterium]
MKSCIHIIGLVIMCWQSLEAQPGYELLKDVDKLDIPFEFSNNLILVNVVFQGIFPLKFIFDTGAEHSILSKSSITDVLGIPYEREFKIYGSDMKTELTAYLIRGIHLKIETMVAPSNTMLVLKEDYFNFDELVGFNVDGIIGADMFKGLIVKINYEKKLITLMKNKSVKKATEGMQAIPIRVEKNKPYLSTVVQTQGDSTVNVKLLLDTGAMLSLLLNSDSHPGLKPPTNAVQGNIGAGLGGFLTGHLGRVASLQMGAFQCQEVLTNFQTATFDMDTVLLRNRNGVIGNEVLSRFEVIIDYPAQKLYLKPNRRFLEKFEFDKSGLVVIATDYQLSKFLVHSVIPGSPAELAGIKAGDEIKRINFAIASLMNLKGINATMRKKEGKKIVLVVKRDGKRMKFEFRLRKLI